MPLEPSSIGSTIHESKLEARPVPIVDGRDSPDLLPGSRKATVMATHPIRIKGLDHVVLRVKDLERSIAFYSTVIGCAVERRIDELGLVQLRAGASLIDLVGVDTPLGRTGGEAAGESGRNVDHFALTLHELDSAALATHLSGHGVANDAPARRYGAEGFGPSLYIQDPDGNTLELKGPPEADSASGATGDG
jgi:glyoxylase I family protein